MTTSTLDAGFKIGIELETLLGPKRRRIENFADLNNFAQIISRPIATLRAVPRLE
jgi:hypothetical protein